MAKKEEIIEKLTELEISHDAGSKKDELAALLSPETLKSLDAKPELVACMVLRDFWNEDGERVRKGEGIEVAAEAAMDGMELGTLERIKK